MTVWVPALKRRILLHGSWQERLVLVTYIALPLNWILSALRFCFFFALDLCLYSLCCLPRGQSICRTDHGPASAHRGEDETKREEAVPVLEHAAKLLSGLNPDNLAAIVTVVSVLQRQCQCLQYLSDCTAKDFYLWL